MGPPGLTPDECLGKVESSYFHRTSDDYWEELGEFDSDGDAWAELWESSGLTAIGVMVSWGGDSGTDGA